MAGLQHILSEMHILIWQFLASLGQRQPLLHESFELDNLFLEDGGSGAFFLI
jgi:hypothetical protein